MSWWSDNIGGGNSFGESVANTFTSGDGKEYQGGSLVDTNTNQVISGGFMDSNSTNQTGSSVGSKTTGHGDSKNVGEIVTGVKNELFGLPESLKTEENKTKGTYKSLSTGQIIGGVLTGGASLLPSLISGFTSWANDIDPETQAEGTFPDSKGNNRQVYNNGNGMQYSYNFLNMPYEVSIIDGEVVDTLAQPVDDKGRIYSDPNYDATKLTNQTAYQYNSSQNAGNGGDDNNNDNQALQDYAAANAGEGEGGGTGSGTTQEYYDQVLEMAKAAGFNDIKGTQEEIIANAMKYLEDRNLKVADEVPTLDVDTEGAVLDEFGGLDDLEQTGVATTGDANVVGTVPTGDTTTYDTTENVITSDLQADAVTGTIDADNLVDADSIEIDVAAENKGEGVMGNSLDNFASQSISTVINTSTVEGKMLAEKLGEGNYTDHKATLIGQIEIISGEFKDSNGQARIPTWAQANLRNIQQTVAFGGMTGSAATEAYANAIMEATIGVADKEAAFFQTLTIANLDNKQASIINKAKVLAQFEMGNLDARETAAVQNAKAFLEMDLQNLTNEQQAEVLNKQAMVDALFKNTEASNAQALFTAESKNDMETFYAELNATIQRHNATEINALKKFNAGEINDNSEFLADMKNSRQQYVGNMQYNIDVANATWRQQVATTNNQNEFDAASTDIKNALGLTQEAQNALWDDADNLLDYIWKSADNDQQRELLLLTAQLQAQSGQQDSGSSFWKSVLSIGGAVLGAGSKPWWMGA